MLYLMIVNMPSDEELAAAAQLTEQKQTDEIENESQAEGQSSPW